MGKTKSTSKKSATTTTKKKTLTDNEARKIALAAAILKFPRRFTLRDRKEVVCMIDVDASTADALKLVDGTGEVVATLTPKELEKALVKLPKEKRDESKSKSKKQKSERGENQVTMMARLILEGKSWDEIVAAFAERFATQYLEKQDPKFVEKRCRIFRYHAKKDSPEVAAKLSESESDE